MTTTEMKLETATHFDADFHIQRAREMRSAYMAELFSSLFAKVKELFHVKSSHKAAVSH